MSVFDLIRAGAPQGGRPARHLLAPAQFAQLPAALAAEPAVALLSLWAEPALVHAAFLDEAAGALLLASCPAESGHYPALSPARPGAVRFERMVRELWGLTAEGGQDLRPWLDHGRWPLTTPLAARPGRNGVPAGQPTFLPIEGEGWHQIPVGPVHAGIIEPGHFRFTVQGEMVVRLEQRLGYTHKGTLGLMLGKSPRTAARFAARLSGDSTVAHSLAFAEAAEAATATPAPPRAQWLRAVMLEQERLANHLNDWGFICNDAAFAFPLARLGLLREAVLRANAAAFGHRLMMDRVVPGGVAADLAEAALPVLLATLAAVEAELPGLAAIYDDHASLQDRVVGTGVLRPDLAARFAAGGVVGRASARRFDARLAFPAGPYAGSPPGLAVREAGDVDARVRVRMAEITDSIRLLRRFLATLPPGEIYQPLPQRGGEALALVEGFRGEIATWMALDDGGLIRAVFPRDPSWLQWPLLEAAVEGNIVADFPLCNKSFNCSYSGVDL
ncbi:hydrogenase large subunit [Falsiroseomonas selenitidurans]|uniref:Hydrogenase expression protein HypE n=1 Tax=Falsiroseomonas selenitidurans TaxID=2716335 RepID=A0ABX1E5Z9_9PROT|nr:NADH-quinone oxidoreductase subunit C [Falsiroseomonas selenitidurans]NKC32614.1 hydrogenase expression protein HypE [Falsiroseomonas selenitidurans]